MNNNTKKILAAGAVGVALIPVIHYHRHEDILEPDYTQGNTIQYYASGYNDTTSVMGIIPRI